MLLLFFEVPGTFSSSLDALGLWLAYTVGGLGGVQEHLRVNAGGLAHVNLREVLGVLNDYGEFLFVWHIHLVILLCHPMASWRVCQLHHFYP